MKIINVVFGTIFLIMGASNLIDGNTTLAIVQAYAAVLNAELYVMKSSKG